MHINRTERRRHPRQHQAMPIEVIAGERPILSRLTDVSFSGVQFQTDPEDLDYVTKNITAVRLHGSDRLAIRVVWGLYDGSIGAVFENPAAARPIVSRLLGDHRAYDEAGR